ncbi:MAG TPA: hypothetical protein VIU29_09440 [Candidatus Deferrimicrobiaceae bacterium]
MIKGLFLTSTRIDAGRTGPESSTSRKWNEQEAERTGRGKVDSIGVVGQGHESHFPLFRQTVNFRNTLIAMALTDWIPDRGMR